MEHINGIINGSFKLVEKRYESRSDEKNDINMSHNLGLLDGLYLRDCLNALNRGKGFAGYTLSVSQLVGFIRTWMESNPEDFPELFVRRDWNAIKTEDKLTLPYSSDEKEKYVHNMRTNKFCEDSSHKERTYDLAGRLRCANINLRLGACYKLVSNDPTNSSSPAIAPIPVILSLETILDRLNEVDLWKQERKKDRLKTIFSFNEYVCALYIKKWYQQNPSELEFYGIK